LTESIIDKEPFVVACISAYDEEGTIARVVLMAERYVDPRAHGDALNKRPRSFIVGQSLP